MARRKDLNKLRNEAIKARYAELKLKHPQWRYDALVDQLKCEYFLAPSTLVKILTDNT